MAAKLIARKLVVLVLALTLMVGVAPMAMAGPAMTGCDMAMAAMDMPASLIQDQPRIPMQKQQTPSKDADGCCTAACAGTIGLFQIGYSLALAGTPADPVWPVQAEWARTRSRPELPPPIAFL